MLGGGFWYIGSGCGTSAALERLILLVTEGCGALCLVLGGGFWYIGSGGMGPFGMITFVLPEIRWDWGDPFLYAVDKISLSRLYYNLNMLYAVI